MYFVRLVPLDQNPSGAHRKTTGTGRVLRRLQESPPKVRLLGVTGGTNAVRGMDERFRSRGLIRQKFPFVCGIYSVLYLELLICIVGSIEEKQRFIVGAT